MGLQVHQLGPPAPLLCFVVLCQAVAALPRATRCLSTTREFFRESGINALCQGIGALVGRQKPAAEREGAATDDDQMATTMTEMMAAIFPRLFAGCGALGPELTVEAG